MVKQGFLKFSEDAPVKVWIPFNPHFFHHIHCNWPLLRRFHVSYVREDKIDANTHKLAFST